MLETPSYTPKKPSRAKSYNALNEKHSDSDGQEKKPASLGRASGRRARSAAREHDEESGLPPSREKKKESPSKTKASGPFRPRMLTILAALTMLFGPVGTVLTYMLMPKETAITVEAAAFRHTGSASSSGHMRVLHLALAGTDTKARFVIDDRSTWETVIAGCKERLQIAGVGRITDSSGEAIMSVHDLIHEDTLVVFALNSTASLPARTAGGGGSASAARVAPKQDPPCPATKHPEFRVAMLIPLLGTAPAYLPYFMATAGQQAPLVDWLIFHEHLAIPWEKPANIKFVDLGGAGLAELVGLKLGEQLNLPLRNATMLLRSLKLLFERWPRLVAEYKPTFGSVFEDFITGYSHWGYCDLDMALGNLGLFMERPELEEHDVVTYAFGDMGALYLRGQWTIHRNDPEVNTVWRRCAHLGADLQKELSTKVTYLKQMDAAGRKGFPTRFVSAEGCYSYEAVQAKLKLKIALKQAVGLEATSRQQIIAVGGAVWACGGDVTVDQALLRNMRTRTELEPCRTTLPPLQRPVGSEVELAAGSEGCGMWMPAEFRMCLKDEKSLPGDGKSVAVYSRGGKFYGQELEDPNLEMPNGCRQMAFFHFQEWKKLWEQRPNSVPPLLKADTLAPPAFRISTEGINLLRHR